MPSPKIKRLHKMLAERGIHIAKNSGSIRVAIELITGSVGDSAPEEVLKKLMDELVEDLKSLETISKFWRVNKFKGYYEPYNEHTDAAKYEPDIAQVQKQLGER